MSLLSLRAVTTLDEWNDCLAVEDTAAREGRHRRMVEAIALMRAGPGNWRVKVKGPEFGMLRRVTWRVGAIPPHRSYPLSCSIHHGRECCGPDPQTGSKLRFDFLETNIKNQSGPRERYRSQTSHR